MGRIKPVRLLAVGLLVVGLGLLVAPKVGQELYQSRVDREQQQHREQVGRLEEENPGILEELYRAMVDYNTALYQSGQAELTDPFSYEQVALSLRDFGLEEERIGTLNIPRMGVTLPVYLGASRENMAAGAAHLTQTSMPVGGMHTNAVICAHRGTVTAAMFRDIQKLELGDRITLSNFWGTLSYEVAELRVIHPGDIDEILIRPGEDLITLLTCHPYGSNAQRYLVRCRRVET